MSQIPTSESSFESVAEQPGWPKGVGITSIVWGGLWTACGLCGTGYFLFAPQLLKMGEQQLGPAPDVLKPPPAQIALTAVGTLIAVLLVVAGIMVLKRNPLGRILHLAYGVLSLVITAVSIFVQLGVLKTMKEWVAANPDNKWAAQMNVGAQVPMMVVMTAISIAWPLFCIVWFGMIKNKPDSMGVAVKRDVI